MHSRIRIGATLLLVLSALFAVPQAEIIEQVLVKVNGEIFTKTELEARQVSALRTLGQQVDPTTKPSDAELRKMLEDVTPQLVVSIVDEMLLVQRGKELGYTLTDEQFKNILENIKKENKIESDEAFQAALKQENMTMTELRRSLERQTMVSQVTRNEIAAKLTVSEDETRKFYEAHVKEFTTAPTVTLREVLIAAPADAAADVATAARQKAEATRARALAGESFEKLVGEVSEAPSRANAGLIGPLSLDDLAPQIRQTIEPMKDGDMTAVLRTSTGYQILKLEASTPRQIAPFEKVRDQVSERVYEEKQANESRKYLEKLRSQALIEWKNADLKKAYDAGLQRLNAGA